MSDDEPTVILENGDKLWKNDSGKLHRTDGPAYIGDSGYKEWCRNGETHRIDGPAIIYGNEMYGWAVHNYIQRSNKEFQAASGISDEDMLAMILKYGNVK